MGILHKDPMTLNLVDISIYFPMCNILITCRHTVEQQVAEQLQLRPHLPQRLELQLQQPLPYPKK